MNTILKRAIVLNIILLSIFSTQCLSSQTRRNLKDIPVYMHYMPWFDSPDYNNTWGIHWSMSTKDPQRIIDTAIGKREIASHYYPLIGAYDSQDPMVVEYHILLMKYSGVDGILMNWYGRIGINGDVDILLENSNAIVEVADQMDMNFSVIMEDRFVGTENGYNPVDYVYINIEYLKNHYFNKDNFIRTDDQKPFFGIFGPIHITGESDWNYALSAADEEVMFLPLYWDRHKLNSEANNGYDWVLEDGLSATSKFYEDIAPQLNHAMACAYPGFEDYYEEGGWGDPVFHLSPQDGYLLNRSLELAKAHEDEIDALQLITWNDYGEGTIIEPTFEFGFERLKILQTQLGSSYSEYELHQIYRLYTLRKKYHDDANIQNTLDEVCKHFIAYKPSQAIDLMDLIEEQENTSLVKIKNRLNGQYLYQDNQVVKYGDYKNSNLYKWKIESAGDGFYFIKNASTNDKINIENFEGVLECSDVSENAWSAMWEKRTIDGIHLRFLSRWIRDQYMHIENETGIVQHSLSERFWYIGHWIIEELEDHYTNSQEDICETIIYPNPAANLVNITSLNNIEDVQVYNISGKCVEIENLQIQNNVATFNVERVKPGLYVINVRGKMNQISSMIIVK